MYLLLGMCFGFLLLRKNWGSIKPCQEERTIRTVISFDKAKLSQE
jgi:hypothetical protein